MILEEAHLHDIITSNNQVVPLFASYFSSIYKDPQDFSKASLDAITSTHFIFLPTSISISTGEINDALISIRNYRGSRK